MMTPERLQILSPEDPLARLRIIADGIVSVDVVLRIGIAGCRCAPVRIQGFTYLFVLRLAVRLSS